MDESFSTYSLIVGTLWPFVVNVFCKVLESGSLMKLEYMAVRGGLFEFFARMSIFVN